MDTPLAAAVHKENVHIGGGKATVMKHDMLKTAKTVGKQRKVLGDLRSTNGPGPVAAASKDVDLKQKSAMKGNKIKKNPPSSKKQLGIRIFGKGNTPSSGHILTDKEIKQCCEWAKDGIEEMGGYSCSAKDEANLLMNQTLSEIMASAIGVPITELEKPISSDEEGYETDGSDLNSSISIPDDACLLGEAMDKCAGRFSSLYTLEELDDPLVLLDDYPFPELKLNDDYKEFSIDNDGRIDENEDEPSINHKRLDIAEEVDHVYERLQALKADREFLKYCLSSLKKGERGIDLLQEILLHLRDLRSVELRSRHIDA